MLILQAYSSIVNINLFFFKKKGENLSVLMLSYLLYIRLCKAKLIAPVVIAKNIEYISKSTYITLSFSVTNIKDIIATVADPNNITFIVSEKPYLIIATMTSTMLVASICFFFISSPFVIIILP